MSKERDAILSKWLNDPKVSGRDGVVKAMEEYSRSQSIAFRRWCDEKGYYCQMKDGQLGYIRQENQIVFSAWKSPEDIYDLFIQHQNNQK